MTSNSNSHAGWLASTALVLLSFLGSVKSTEPENDAEPIRYAPAPKFWEEVERVMQSDLKLHWTSHGVIDSARGEREKILDRSREVLAKLKNVSLPQTTGYKRVRTFPMPEYPDYSLLGFLVREEPDEWTVFASTWQISRVKRVRYTRVEPSNVNDEINAALKIAATIQDNTDPGRRSIYEIPPALKDGHNHFNRPHLLFDLAYVAFESDRREAIEPLLRAAFYQHAEMLERLYDDLAWQQFESAVLDLKGGAARAGLARRFQRIAVEFPGGRYKDQAPDYSRKLQQMAAEDAQWRPPSLAQLAPRERVKALVFQLRECNAVQWSQPGACWIPSIFQPVEDDHAKAADLLIQEGFDAVPALIETLEDSRLTRSYGLDRDFIPWRYVLEVRDAAIQSLIVIADDQWDRRFYHSNNTGEYFSNDTPKAREVAIKAVKDWWTEARAMGEAQWLRSRLRTPGQSRPTLMRRLVQIEQGQAVPDVRKWLAEETNYRVYAYQLLLRAGGADAISELQALADGASMKFEFAALSALNREHLITPADYTAALFQGAQGIAKRESGKLPSDVLMALTETGDRQCTLLVAERLRAGKSSFDYPMRCALGSINDPKIAGEVAAYLLPFFDVTETAAESGWRRHYMGKPDIYRIKDDAAFSVNKLLGYPLPNFSDVTPPERDAEIEKLRKTCTDRGIQPAFAF